MYLKQSAFGSDLSVSQKQEYFSPPEDRFTATDMLDRSHHSKEPCPQISIVMLSKDLSSNFASNLPQLCHSSELCLQTSSTMSTRHLPSGLATQRQKHSSHERQPRRSVTSLNLLLFPNALLPHLLLRTPMIVARMIPGRYVAQRLIAPHTHGTSSIPVQTLSTPRTYKVHRKKQLHNNLPIPTSTSVRA